MRILIFLTLYLITALDVIGQNSDDNIYVTVMPKDSNSYKGLLVKPKITDCQSFQKMILKKSNNQNVVLRPKSADYLIVHSSHKDYKFVPYQDKHGDRFINVSVEGDLTLLIEKYRIGILAGATAKKGGFVWSRSKTNYYFLKDGKISKQIKKANFRRISKSLMCDKEQICKLIKNREYKHKDIEKLTIDYNAH